MTLPGDLTAHLAPTGGAATDDTKVVGWTSAPQLTVQKNDVGSSSLGVHRLNAQRGSIDYAHRVQFRYNNEDLWLSRWIEGINDTQVSPNNEAGETLSVTARGILAELDTVCVVQEGGIGHLPFHPSRFFDYRSKYLNRTGWTSPIFPPWPPDTGVAGLYGVHWPPNGFPAPFAGWVWGVGATPDSGVGHMPVGDNYGALAFDLPAGTKIIIDQWAACDDYFELAWDNVPILQGDALPAVSWEDPYRTVRYGTGGPGHLLTWKVTNNDWQWPGNVGNIAGLLFACFVLTDVNQGTITYDNLIFESGPNPNPADETHPIPDQSIWLPYPASAPGFTPGHVMDILLTEAQARGCLPDWEWTFTPTADSNGTPWDITVPYELKWGQKYLDVLQSLAQDDCDVMMSPGSPPTLNMFVKGSVTSSSGITLQGRHQTSDPDVNNLKSYQYQGQG